MWAACASRPRARYGLPPARPAQPLARLHSLRSPASAPPPPPPSTALHRPPPPQDYRSLVTDDREEPDAHRARGHGVCHTGLEPQTSRPQIRHTGLEPQTSRPQICHAGLEPQTSRPQETDLLLTRVRLALDRPWEDEPEAGHVPELFLDRDPTLFGTLPRLGLGLGLGLG